MKRHFLPVLIVFFLWLGSCNNFLYKSFGTLDIDETLDDSIILNAEDYVLYTRTICCPRPTKTFYEGPRLYPRTVASAIRSNCNGASLANEVLEREYLLISKSKKKQFILPHIPRMLRIPSSYMTGQFLITQHSLIFGMQIDFILAY